MKDTTETATAQGEGSSAMKILLKKVSFLNSSVSYIDKGYNMEAYLNDLSFDLKGDMTMSETDLQNFSCSRRAYIYNGWYEIS